MMIDLRRISALLLCELFYNNLEIKQLAMHKLDIKPNGGRV